MHAIEVSRRMLAGLGLLVTIAAAGCTANPAPSPVASGSSQSTGPAVTPPASSPTPTPSASLASAGGVRNLVVSSAIRSQLAAAFVAYKRIMLSDIAGSGPRPGSVYYAYDPATDTYWAQAPFTPSSTASMNVQVGFQDGGEYGFFSRSGTGTWRVQTGGVPINCSEVRFFPRTVLAAWSLPAGGWPTDC